MSENTVQKHVVSASIYDTREMILGRKTKPVFIITVQRGNDICYEITKEYKDFFDLQCSILDTFPEEGGRNGFQRIIPYLPGRKIFRRDDLFLAQERKPELNKYMTELLQLKESISQSKLVLDFFARQDISENMDEEDSLVDMRKESIIGKNRPGVSDLQCHVNTSYNFDEEQQNST